MAGRVELLSVRRERGDGARWLVRMEWHMFWRQYQPGDWVVFRRMKHTTHPGHRAREVHATPHGDEYDYVVDKFWVVVDVRADGKLLVKTRRGKTHLIDAGDRNLRRATWWDRLRYRARFTQLSAPVPAGQPRTSG